MTLLQGRYAIYASKTLFIAAVIGLLLYARQFKLLILVALFGIIMPATDAWLALQASAPMKVVVKQV